VARMCSLQCSPRTIESGTHSFLATILLLQAAGAIMPGKKHLRGVGAKEQRMYEHIRKQAESSGRYGKRAEEVAARTVMKHHAEESHEKGT